MLDSASNLAMCLEKLDFLKKPSRDALTDCHWGSISLLDRLQKIFIVSATDHRDDLLNNRYSKLRIRAKLDLATYTSEVAGFCLAKEYWRALLTKMRQLNKSKEV